MPTIDGLPANRYSGAIRLTASTAERPVSPAPMCPINNWPGRRNGWRSNFIRWNLYFRSFQLLRRKEVWRNSNIATRCLDHWRFRWWLRGSRQTVRHRKIPPDSQSTQSLISKFIPLVKLSANIYWWRGLYLTALAISAPSTRAIPHAPERAALFRPSAVPEPT